MVEKNRKVNKYTFQKQEMIAKLFKSDFPHVVKWIVFIPSFHPSIHSCLPHPLALVCCSLLGQVAFKMVAWQCGNNWGRRKIREGTHLVVIVVNLCSTFYLILLLAICPSVAGLLHCRMLLYTHLTPALLQLPPSLLSFLSWLHRSTISPILPAAFLVGLLDD